MERAGSTFRAGVSILSTHSHTSFDVSAGGDEFESEGVAILMVLGLDADGPDHEIERKWWWGRTGSTLRITRQK
jgi:hypothetical protein